MQKKIKKAAFGVLTFLAPIATFAAINPTQVPTGNPDDTQVTTLLAFVKFWFDRIIPIVVTLGVIYFIWAVIQYVTVKDEEERAGARSHMILGLIAIFVIVSIWGLVGFLASTTGVGQGGQVDLPSVGN